MRLPLSLESDLARLGKIKQAIIEWLVDPWKTILVSTKPLMVTFRWCLFLLWLSIPMFSFRRIIYSLLPAGFYQRDLIQEYLLSKALLAGANPYLPLTELAQRFVPDLPVVVFSHPTPHPPLVALFSLPLAFLTYEQAVIAWFVVELVCVVLAAYLIVAWLGKGRNWKLVALLSLVIMAWEPFVTDIALGQLSFFLLLFLLGGWLCLRQKRDVLGGFFLGLVLALKLMAWPIVLYLALRKRWHAVIASGLVVVFGNALMGLLIGFDTLLYYYLSIGPAASATYRGDAWNLSVFSLGWKLFGGFDSLIAPFFSVLPSVESLSFLAPYMAVLFTFLLLGLSLYFSLRSNVFDIAFGILVCTSILVNPVSWTHYFTWLIIPLVVLGQYLSKCGFPRHESTLAFISLVILTYSWGFVLRLAHVLAGLDVAPEVLFVVGLLLHLPTFGALLLMWILVKVEHRLPVDSCA